MKENCAINNITEATRLRDNNSNLIGQKRKNFNILDVIVIPLDNLLSFLDEYQKRHNTISNDKMLLNYPSKEYIVHAIYRIGVNVIGEDIHYLY